MTPVSVTFKYCTFGGIVGASVIATRSVPRSQVMVHWPRSAFSTSNGPSARQAPNCAFRCSRSDAGGVLRLIEEQVHGRDAIRERVVPVRDEPRDVVLRGEQCRLGAGIRRVSAPVFARAAVA